MKTKFTELLRKVNRQGIDTLIEYLISTDFFTAPASTNYHCNYAGGLVEHSLAVHDSLKVINDSFDLRLALDSMIICGLLHDICKANFYKESYRNQKNPVSGQWEKVPYYQVQDEFPFGHGEKSVVIIQQFIALSREEILAIRWHMGGFDDSAQAYAGARSLAAAMKAHRLVAALHLADMAASYLHGK